MKGIIYPCEHDPFGCQLQCDKCFNHILRNPFEVDAENWRMFWTDEYIRTLLKIKELEEKNTPASFAKLCTEMPILSKHQINEATWVLSEWSLIHREYGSVGNGRCGSYYVIDEMAPDWAQPQHDSTFVEEVVKDGEDKNVIL